MRTYTEMEESIEKLKKEVKDDPKNMSYQMETTYPVMVRHQEKALQTMKDCRDPILRECTGLHNILLADM